VLQLAAGVPRSNKTPEPAAASAAAPPTLDGTEALRHLACGALSAVTSRTLIAPLERIKMSILLSPTALKWSSAAKAIFRDGGAPQHACAH